MSSEKSTGTSNPPATKSTSNKNWFRIFFVLATLDLVAIVFSLYVTHLLVSVHNLSIETDRQWAERLTQYAELSSQVTRLNAPGNDVFSSRKVNHERQRFNAINNEYERVYNRILTDLGSNVESSYRTEIIQALNKANEKVALLKQQANTIFQQMEGGNYQQAGTAMAKMDQAYTAAMEHIASASD